MSADLQIGYLWIADQKIVAPRIAALRIGDPAIADWQAQTCHFLAENT